MNFQAVWSFIFEGITVQFDLALFFITTDIVNCLGMKSTDVTNNINNGSVLFKHPSQPRECDSDPARTIAGP